MGRHQKRPMRGPTEAEKAELIRVSTSEVERVERMRRARALLAVAEGQSFTEAARAARMRSSSGVAAIVQRFHERGMAALDTLPGAGRRPVYSDAERDLILGEVQREMDRTALWSLSTLEQALRLSANGAPRVSAKIIGQVLHDAGYTWHSGRHAWLRDGEVTQERKRDGLV